MTRPRRSTPEELAEVARIQAEHPEAREAAESGPRPRRSGLLAGQAHAEQHRQDDDSDPAYGDRPEDYVV